MQVRQAPPQKKVPEIYENFDFLWCWQSHFNEKIVSLLPIIK